MKNAIILVMLLVSSSTHALQRGESAPDIVLPSTSGENVRLSDYKGSWIVLYFYPKSFTPGCTVQACSLRDHHEEIEGYGAVILGVSMDDIDVQQAFKKEHGLPFDLLSDADKNLSSEFDALGPDRDRIARKTFIIDPDGRIAHRFDLVIPANHSAEVLAVLDHMTDATNN